MEQLSPMLAHVPAALLVVFRLTGLMIYGPIFGSSVVPPRVRVLLAVVLGLAAYPLVAPDRPVAPDLWSLAPAACGELAIGLVVGYLASLPLVAVQVGGLIMGQQMGLGFARFFNPAIEDDADVVGQILFFTTLAGFLAVGGHEAMVLAVLRSFDHLPVPAGVAPLDASLIATLAAVLTAALEMALRVAAPLLAVIFVQTVAMGFVAKTVPQMNILSLGFPLRILGGLAIIVLSLVVIDDVMMEFVDETLDVLFSWIER